MLKHIVMIKLEQAEEPVMKERAIRLEEKLNSLKANIPSLIKMEVGLNISTRPSAYDIVLVSEFESEDGLNIYRVHPKHQEVLAYMKQVVADAKVVDYWV